MLHSWSRRIPARQALSHRIVISELPVGVAPCWPSFAEMASFMLGQKAPVLGARDSQACRTQKWAAPRAQVRARVHHLFRLAPYPGL